MDLHLFDTMQYVYSGAVQDKRINRGVTKINGVYYPRELPCGGIAYLLNTFYEWGGKDRELVFCVDSPPTIKRGIFEMNFSSLGYYKGNRTPIKPEIAVQKRLVVDVLEQIGATVVKAEGYEADDIIASIVKYYREDYEHIYIHSKDSDLFYLVCDNVEILPLNNPDYFLQKFSYSKKFKENGKHINLSNWERAVLKGKICPYDALTIVKLLDGEAGDNIPKVQWDIADKIVKGIPRYDYPKCGDNVYLRERILDITNSDVRTKAILDLIQPIILRYDEIAFNYGESDKRVFEAYAAVTNNTYAKSISYEEQYLIEATIEKYIEYLEVKA